jgi:hypothetical protein
VPWYISYIKSLYRERFSRKKKRQNLRTCAHQEGVSPMSSPASWEKKNLKSQCPRIFTIEGHYKWDFSRQFPGYFVNRLNTSLPKFAKILVLPCHRKKKDFLISHALVYLLHKSRIKALYSAFQKIVACRRLLRLVHLCVCVHVCVYVCVYVLTTIKYLIVLLFFFC